RIDGNLFPFPNGREQILISFRNLIASDLTDVKTESRRQRIVTRPEALLIFKIFTEHPALGRQVAANEVLLLQVEHKLRIGHRQSIPVIAAGATLERKLAINRHRASAPESRVDKWVFLHEQVYQSLGLRLNQSVVPNELSFFFRAFDDLWIGVRMSQVMAIENDRGAKHRNADHLRLYKKPVHHAGIFSCANAIPLRNRALKASESFAA